jgi:hypothetical protein
VSALRLRPFFSFYGGKHRHVGSYPAPLHGRVVECFAGSAGYATRYPSADMTLVDLDPVICGVWRYLIRTPEREIRALPLIAADESLDALGGVPQEARWLVGFWLGKALAAPRLTPSPWMRSGKWPRCFWGESIRERIAQQVEHIRHWRVVEASYADIPRPLATWFVDPPYIDKGVHYRRSSKGVDFAHLGAWCRSLPGQVMVCEQHGADWLPFRPHRAMKTLNRKDGSVCYSREVIWTQGCEPQRSLALGGAA